MTNSQDDGIKLKCWLGLPAARALPKPRTSEWLHSAPTKPLKAKLLPPTSTARQPQDQQTDNPTSTSSSHQLTSTSCHNERQMMSSPSLKSFRFDAIVSVAFPLRPFAIFQFWLQALKTWKALARWHCQPTRQRSVTGSPQTMA